MGGEEITKESIKGRENKQKEMKRRKGGGREEEKRTGKERKRRKKNFQDGNECHGFTIISTLFFKKLHMYVFLHFKCFLKCLFLSHVCSCEF